MSNELRLLKAFIKAQGYEIEEVQRYKNVRNELNPPMLRGGLGDFVRVADGCDYKVTKKPKKEIIRKYGEEAHFNMFWRNYPRKEKKPNAMRAFNGLSIDDQGKAVIDCKTRYNGVENKKYIPLPASYLNAHSFNDDPLPNQKEFTKEQKEARRQELKKEDWARVPDSLEFKVVVDWAERHGYSRPVQGITILGYKSSLNNQIKARTEREI